MTDYIKPEKDENVTFDIPVVLFVFRRLDTVKLIMEQIALLKPRKLYVFADAARHRVDGEEERVQAVRDFVKNGITWDCEKTLSFRDHNYGCANNIIDGINTVFRTEPWAIILEDDAVPKQDFFFYCQYLLKKYEQGNVQFIAGFNAIGDMQIFDSDYAFSQSAPMSGAIATWAKRWNECDFSMKEWPRIKKSKAFRDTFYFREIYRLHYQAFEDSFKNINDGWDYQFHFDMLAKGLVAIVPKGNLVRSYGFAEGAFHPQSARQAKNLKLIMNYSSFSFEEPVNDPEFEVCKPYDRMRQKLFLEVNGNYLQRHIHYAKIEFKGILYRLLPETMWNFLKKLWRK